VKRPPTETWWDVACNISEVPVSSFMSSDWIPYDRENMWDQLMGMRKSVIVNTLADHSPEECFMIALFMHWMEGGK
jgi:hypothetical protein